MSIERHSSMVPSEPGELRGPGTHLTGTPYGYGGQGGLDPGKVGAILRRRAWTIVLGFVSVMAAVTVITFLWPKSYDSTASFLVEEEKSTDSAIPSLDVLKQLGQLASRETEVTLIRSRRVVGPVVDEGDLDVTVGTPDGDERPLEVFASFEAGRDAVPGTYDVGLSPAGGAFVVDAKSGDTIATATKGKSLAFANVTAGPLLPSARSAARNGRLEVRIIPFEQAVNQTQKRLKAAPVEQDADLVELTCSDRTAESAQWLCASVSASYLALRTDLQHQEASAAAKFLSEQASKVKARLAAAEDSLQLFAQRRQAVALNTKADAEVRQNAQIWAQREELVAERDALDSLTRQIESDSTRGPQRYRDFASFPTFVKNQNQVVPQLVESLIELDNRRNDLAVYRTDKDPELAALDRRIRAVEDQIRNIAVGYSQALTAQIGSLEQTLVKSNSVLDSIPAQEIETARLQRQVSLLDDLYKFLQSRLQQAQVAQAVELPSVRVVDRASLPFKPAWPNMPLSFGLGAFLAMSCGLLMALWREHSDTRIQERGALEYETGIPVLGMVPALKRPGPVISLRYNATNGDAAATHLPAWTPERARALEAFRTLSSDLGYVGRDLADGGIRLVAVTSSTRGEGKTYTACNLAIARASHGARTLLVDGDLRGRGLSRFLKLPARLPGLTEILETGGEASEQIRSFQVGAESTLWVISAGAGTSRSAELLESERFRLFLQAMRSRFDFVVIDTPPLNLVTDAAAVSTLADGVVLVVRRGVTDRAGLDLTLERLHRAGGNTAGIVLNDALLPISYTTYSHVE